jgi:tetratricopeptide (TPR) repeat protein
VQAKHETVTGRTSHLSSGRHRKTAPVVAEQTSSRHGRRHRLTEASKQKTRVATSKGHRQEQVSPVKSKKEEEEVETVEPPSIRVDTEELIRAYARYDSGINKRLSGNYLAAIADLQEARQIFHEHALKESPMESFAALELGQAADEAGNYYLARHIYEELKAKSPSSLSLRLKLARLEAKNGEIYDALREAREAVSLDPTAPEAHMMLSLILDRAGSAMEAIVEKQRASELAGRNLQADF